MLMTKAVILTLVPQVLSIHLHLENCRKRVDKFLGKSDENDFEVWLVDFTEATTDCSWTDNERARWFSWFLSGSAKVTWQRTVKTEDKTSWQKIRS